MSKFIVGTRYLVIVPIIGLALAAAALFIFGGYSLIKLVVEQVLMIFGLIEGHEADVPIFVELVEHVHTFLIGTVLYITSVGFFQLFIKEIDFPEWLRIGSTEELETSLIGVTVVVLPVNFMALAFTSSETLILQYGAGIALPIAALSLFVGMRAWAKKIERGEMEKSAKTERER